MRMKLGERLARKGLYTPVETEVCEFGKGLVKAPWKFMMPLNKSIYEGISAIRIEELRLMDIPYRAKNETPLFGEPYTSGIIIKHPALEGKSRDEIVGNPKLLHFARNQAMINAKDDPASKIVEEIMEKRFSEYYGLRKGGLSAADALRKMGYEGRIKSDVRIRVDRKTNEWNKTKVDRTTHLSELCQSYAEIESLTTWNVMFGKSPEIPEL